VPGDGPTSNLGILMEGATDAEATAIARKTASACGITVMDLEPGPHYEQVMPGRGFVRSGVPQRGLVAAQVGVDRRSRVPVLGLLAGGVLVALHEGGQCPHLHNT
jgi:hypothetical protein